MINERHRRFNILSWPIWVKLMAGLILAVVLPAVLVLSVLLSVVSEVTREKTIEHLEEESARQQQLIQLALTQAQTSLNSFAATLEEGTMRQIVPVDTGSQDGLLFFARQSQDAVLNVGNGYFQRIDLIDANGFLVMQSFPGRSQSLIGGESLINSEAFNAGIKASLRRQSQVTVISSVRNNNQPLLQIVQLIQYEGENNTRQPVLAYLVATLNNETVLYNNLAQSDEDITYLVTDTGLVITRDGLLQSDTAPIMQTTAVQRALDNRAGVERYTDGGVEYFRYYTPITGSPLVFLTEAPANAVANEISNGLVTRSFALVVGLLFLIAVLVVLGNQLIAPPLGRIMGAIQAMSRGNFNAPLPDAARSDEIGELASSFADAREWVQTVVSDLETRIAARVRDVEATQDISRYAATQRDLQRLMDQVVNLILERFSNIYHAQIFLIDKEGQYAVLRASTGEPGRRLLERGHRLAVGSVSVIGQTTDQGQVVVARDTAASRVHKKNEFLPDTLAELAIPLRVGDRIIGALDVQSKQAETFSQDQINVLHTMADQISVAIENARLYQESLLRLEEIERNRRASTLQAWREYALSQRSQTLNSEAGTAPTNHTSSELREAAVRTGKTMIGQVTERNTIPIAVPIRLRDQILGAVEWELPQDGFDQNKVQLAQELTDRLAVSLENARLFHESQRATDRERLVNDIAARLTNQNDIDQILQMAVREVGQALRSPQVTIRLNQANGTNGSNGHHEHN